MKSAAQLDREIAEALSPARPPKPRVPKTQRLKIYDVEARIESVNSGDTIWEGTLELPAKSKKELAEIVTKLLHESPYYDDRIDPVARFTSQHSGEVEAPLPSEIEEERMRLFRAALLATGVPTNRVDQSLRALKHERR